MSSRSCAPPSENVFLFVPNLIGYARIGLAVLSFYYMAHNPWMSMSMYAVSCLLDAVDGHAARCYNQSSKFGAVLDMVTDRSTTSALVVFLATQYPGYAFPLQILTALDLSSHYMQMYASLTCGHASHKTVSPSAPWILRMYYTSKPVLFSVCMGNEFFFIGLYLRAWGAKQLGLEVGMAALLWSLIMVCFTISIPIMAFKQVVNAIQLVEASEMLAQADVKSRCAQKACESSVRRSD
ncbi:hypothetical protein BATDEDRAFT_12351 [Batrachochytrium dendrobatidis JAM81]|uniref:CDP-diacylglycerol--inositol 3-phosphatidyltransferase n=2 Tax=Batrachochytrium dendrobatidis TaxID=109871 RepID=F4P6F7_BATDJ|nr:CDP-diacylglycerol--inositol 3-phosphatidyltransferase [Batrachochytrium dendrobatidis JAM81]EGF79340.1 hypothetical protein BATDEDRAFT_12351 [Batrachochytrium dendrobatidis JAM81]|eukprot:XP_006679801.1 hypothetical protein BATDEDRAFT_12351 [Batrachochytrium dendrobatidis JAM81]